MKQNENLYKALRDKLSAYKKEAPPEVWNNINSHLDKRKNKPWLPPFLSILAMVVLIAAGLFYFVNERNTTTTLSHQQDNTMNTTDSPTHHQIVQTPDSLDYQHDNMKSNTAELDNQVEQNMLLDEEGSAYANDTSAETSAYDPNSKNTRIKPSLPAENIANYPKESETESKRLNSSESDRTEITEKKENIHPLNKETKGIDDVTPTSQKLGEQQPPLKSTNQSASPSDVQNEDNNSNKSLHIVKPDSDLQDRKGELPMLPLITKSSTLTPLKYAVESSRKNLPPINLSDIAETDNSGSIHLFAEANIGLGVASRTLTLHNAAYTDLFNNKTNLETPIQNEAYAIYIGALWNKGLAVKTGIELFRQWERYSYVDNFAVIDEPLIVYDTSFVDGEQLITADTVADYKIGRHKYRHYNKISSVDIPIILSYEKPYNNWIFGIEGGIFFNLTQAFEGHVAGPDKIPVAMGDDVLPYKYLTQVGIGFYGGFIISYALKHGWEIGIHPRMRYNPYSLMSNESLISQKNVQFNVNLSTRKYF